MPENIKDQVLGLWFFKNYRNPVEIQVFIELDVDEVDNELKETCKLKEEVKGDSNYSSPRAFERQEGNLVEAI